MIKSMTGYGQSLADDGHVQLSVEIRTLNSKFLDLNLRLPKSFSDKELEIRNLISDILERGKVSLIIDYVRIGEEQIKQTYSEPLFKAYYSELKRLADSVGDKQANLFELALESPEVVQSTMKEDVNEDDWKKLLACIKEATTKCDVFREKEGQVLEKMLEGCIQTIEKGLEQVAILDPNRVKRIREKLNSNIASFFGESYDANRLEQEIIFYAEKFDINEEKVRLKSHLDYFLEVIRTAKSNGKKLSFIAQEIGREINTIGSKANDAEIQKCVVSMKEELEKIKEQLNNVI